MKLRHLAAVGALAVIAGIASQNLGKRVGPDDIYPKVSGEVNLSVNQENIQQTICKSGWTATIRPSVSYTTALKVKQLKELKYADQDTKDTEEDHFISLELGGSPTSTRNLWPEPYTASIPTGGARNKDKVETFLKNQVCAGKITLKEAQSEITKDWYKVYNDNFNGKFGATESFDLDDE